MDLHDFLNLRRVRGLLAMQCGCTVREFKENTQKMIDRNWENAQSVPEERVHWDKYFPDGKPTTEQFILCLGHIHEKGEEMPWFFREAE